MPTATYTGGQDFSEPIDLGQARSLVFPRGQAVPVPDEVAQVLVKKHAAAFAVLDDAGQPVEPSVPVEAGEGAVAAKKGKTGSK